MIVRGVSAAGCYEIMLTDILHSFLLYNVTSQLFISSYFIIKSECQTLYCITKKPTSVTNQMMEPKTVDSKKRQSCCSESQPFVGYMIEPLFCDCSSRL